MDLELELDTDKISTILAKELRLIGMKTIIKVLDISKCKNIEEKKTYFTEKLLS
jgi:hypothetical protein